jgi:glutamate-1-semialdehyde aminotransferase/thioesterase domain-containing protein/acyl carrier protein
MSNESTAGAEEALAKILNDASGFDLRELDRRASFLELGFDSLFLIQFTQKIKNQLKVKVTFRQLIEEIPTIDALVQFVAKNAPAPVTTSTPSSHDSPSRDSRPPSSHVSPSRDSRPPSSHDTPSRDPQSPSSHDSPSRDPQPPSSHDTPSRDPHPTTAPNSTTPPVALHSAAVQLAPVPQPVAVQQPVAAAPAIPINVVSPLPSIAYTPQTLTPSTASSSALEQIITQQNQLMAIQLQLLSGLRVAQPPASIPSIAANPSICSPAPGATLVAQVAPPQTAEQLPAGLPVPTNSATDVVPTVSAAPSSTMTTAAPQPKFERFGPYKPVRKSATGGLTEQQKLSLNRFMERFIAKTQRSREHAQKHRPHFADPRGVAGYRRVWKSIVYQISVERSAGSKLWDIDGNEYIDIAMGFGLNLFGQSPDFVTAALHQQLDRGVEVGPQSPLAGEVASLLCDFSRKDRVTFCNTGSEAVMAAMRLARTVTGKSKIVFFNKDYHGNFEEVLLRSNQVGNQRKTQPAAPGVPQSFADNAIVLDYGTPEALQAIRENADEIAAVLVEPVQSADPFNKPREFLHEVRRLTRELDIALIMDEVITGFRAAQGGAQEWYDVWGDMATYGKVLGGGLPIGALAGSSRFMDALDGGFWKYEDETEPTADMTFFAGTFVRHPLAMTAAHQILMKVKEEGPELQLSLTRKTSYLVDELNRFFSEELFPFRVAQFTSLFRFMFPSDLEYADLLYFHLLERGIFTRGWGDNCFLSTAHSDEDVRKIIEAVKSSCLEIREGGFMPKADQEAHSSSLIQQLSPKPNGSHPAPIPASQTTTALHSIPQTKGLTTTASHSPQFDRSNRISTLEEIQDGGHLPPLFCMPAADGLSLVYHHLAEELGPEQPVYGLTSPGVYGEEIPLTIEEMAQRFVEDIREFRPHGPYLLMGYCSGGTIAFEAAQQLLAAGEEVAFVAGIETYDWGTAQSSRPTPTIKAYYNLQRIEFHFRNFLLLGIHDKWAFLKSKLNRAKTRTKNWRGMLAGLFSKQQAVSSTGAVNMHELWRLHDAQADRYRPKPLPGKLLLIRPKKDYRSYVGKEDLKATGGVKIVRIPAFPAGLMTPPYVSQVAKLVKDSIHEGLQSPTRITHRETVRETASQMVLVGG